jgi:hypothetical protein
MAKCPFAIWDPINGGLGAFNGEPFKIIHHTTEGSSFAAARAAFQSNKSDPHFTVDAATIHQHIDTAETARSLKNKPGGVETNRSSAIQIEMVGSAGRPKDPVTLANVARLCRWIESTHGVPQRWPNGFPRFSTNGKDPGGHNRDSHNWVTESGHYGHSQAPENIHWDPGYTSVEVAVVTPAAAMPAPAPVAVTAAPVVAEAPLASLAALEGIAPEAAMATVAAAPERAAAADEPTAAAAEHLLARLLDLLEPLGAQAAGQRLFFPEGIRDVELSVKTAVVEISLKLSGGQKAG